MMWVMALYGAVAFGYALGTSVVLQLNGQRTERWWEPAVEGFIWPVQVAVFVLSLRSPK